MRDWWNHQILTTLACLLLVSIGCSGGGNGEADPCDGVTCSFHGSCRVENGTAQCECDRGFIAEGLGCVAEGSDGDADIDGDGDSDGDADGDADGDIDAELDAESDSAADGDADSDLDERSDADEEEEPEDCSLFYDGFEDGIADGWVEVRGDWSVVSDGDGGHAYRQSSTSGAGTEIPELSYWDGRDLGDVSVAVHLQYGSGRPGWDGFGIVYRYVDDMNYYMTILNANYSASNPFALVRVVDGIQTQLASAPTSNLDSHWVTVIAEGDRHRVLKDGVVLLDVRDDSHSTGRVGVWSTRMSGSFDDFAADDCEGLATPTFVNCPESVSEGDFYTMRWTAVPGAHHYDYEFRRVGGTSPIDTWTRTGGDEPAPRYLWGVNLSEGHPTYEFRVRGVALDGAEGPYSEVCSVPVI